jgi:hypothetical protein
MPRDFRAAENQKRAKARRQGALERNELRQPSAPRQAAAGATSFAVKAEDPSDRAAIDAFLAARRGS